MDWTYNYMHCYIDYPPLKVSKMLKESDLDRYLEKFYNKPIDRILKEDAPDIIKRLRRPSTIEKPIINKTKNKKMKKSTVAPSCEVTTPAVENMKPKAGNAPPSGKIGKGGPAKSPVDGKSLKVKGGKSPKKGK